jgi:hypothetical protein
MSKAIKTRASALLSSLSRRLHSRKVHRRTAAAPARTIRRRFGGGQSTTASITSRKSRIYRRLCDATKATQRHPKGTSTKSPNLPAVLKSSWASCRPPER